MKLLTKYLVEAKCTKRLKAGVLHALGTLCLYWDDARQQVIHSKVMSTVVQGLSDSDETIRAAAALALRALSRSVRTLRASVVDADVAAPLCRLLSDDNVEVQVSAVVAAGMSVSCCYCDEVMRTASSVWNVCIRNRPLIWINTFTRMSHKPWHTFCP